MSPGAAYSVVERVFNGSIIPWQSEQAAKIMSAQITDVSSLYHRALATAFDYPQSEESKRIFAFLGNQIPDLDQSLIGSPERLKEWWYKILLLGRAYLMVHQKAFFDQKAFGEERLSDEMQAFASSLETHIVQTKELIEQLPRNSLIPFLHFDDLVNQGDDIEMPGPNSFIRRRRANRRIPNELYDIMNDAYSKGSEEQMNLYYFKVDEPLYCKRDSMQASWTWQEMVDVLGVLPSFASQVTILQTIDAFDDNFDAELAEQLDPSQLSPQGILTLLHYDIMKNIEPLSALEAHVDKPTPEETVSFSSFSLPKALVPVASIKFLSAVAVVTSEDAFRDLLTKAQSIVFRRGSKIPTNTHEWLLLLTLLRDSADDIVRQRVIDVVDAQDFPHEPFRDVFLNRKPGSIWLLDNGNIRVHDGTLSNACCIYTSSFVPPERPHIDARPASETPTISFKRVAEPALRPETIWQKRDKRAARPQTPIQQVLAEGIVDQEVARPHLKMALPPGKTLSDICRGISLIDQELVATKIMELNEQGKGRVEKLRSKSPEGLPYYKMRINGCDSGIRVFSTKNGDILIAEKALYRGRAYKDL